MLADNAGCCLGEEVAILKEIIALDRDSAAYASLAGELLLQFGDLQHVLRAEPGELKALLASGAQLAAHFRKFLQLATALARQELRSRNILDSTERVVSYCRLRTEDPRREQLFGLYLDGDFRLISEKLLQNGTVNHVTVYPREILRHALIQQAAHVVLIHNHPGGNPQPGRRDTEMTRELASVSNRLGIGLADHIILGENSFFSFRESGKLRPCQAERAFDPAPRGSQFMRVGV
jgi:DNA repair protein RadC